MKNQEEVFKELAKGVKTQKDLEGLTRQLMKTVLETALRRGVKSCVSHFGVVGNKTICLVHCESNIRVPSITL